ncbi:CU044_2847 family protein [Microbispora sp. H10836]|uniref:CU044_2847 family protein n=1 Tax=Microbispora sp. H10836 TaxID=2729106 RepID=UPI001B8AD5A1|nr:CU044_2847 family protein [Microbispora sp. H10836]
MYELDESTQVRFEVDVLPGYQPAGGPEEIVGSVREALEPAVRAAKLVLDKAKEVSPHEIQVKFGIKVTGTMNWLVAKAATEGNFEVSMTWRPSMGKSEEGIKETHGATSAEAS